MSGNLSFMRRPDYCRPLNTLEAVIFCYHFEYLEMQVYNLIYGSPWKLPWKTRVAAWYLWSISHGIWRFLPANSREKKTNPRHHSQVAKHACDEIALYCKSGEPMGTPNCWNPVSFRGRTSLETLNLPIFVYRWLVDDLMKAYICYISVC